MAQSAVEQIDHSTHAAPSSADRVGRPVEWTRFEPLRGEGQDVTRRGPCNCQS